MRVISRFLLGIVTSAVPVVIAACYGVAYTFSQHGRVVDKTSKSGVAGLRVDCRTASNAVSDSTTSASDGAFALSSYDPSSCTDITVEDEREVGPHYAPYSVKSDPGNYLTIEVSPQP